MLCQAREMNSHVQQLQLATWQVGAKGLVGHLSNPLYCTWMLEMYHIRGQNSHYKKLVWNERIKEGSKNTPKANLTPRCPAAYVIFENVLKEGINRACKAYFALRSIWTFDWPRVGASQKVIPRERLPATLLIGSSVKKENKTNKNKNAWARTNKASGTMPWKMIHYQYKFLGVIRKRKRRKNAMIWFWKLTKLHNFSWLDRLLPSRI